jgi:hypothetical protein
MASISGFLIGLNRRSTIMSRFLQTGLAATIITMVFCVSAWGISRDEVLFHASFDKGYDADVARGNPKGTASGNVSLVAGRTGRGIIVGAGAVRYQTAGNIDLPCGTAALWLKPVDWDKDPYIRHFFDVPGVTPGCYMSLYKYQTMLYYLVQQSYDIRQYILTGKDYDFTKGKWTHVAGSWNGPELRVYIDGEYAGSTGVPTGTFVKQLRDSFSLGGVSQRPGHPPDTVLDDFYIFNRALSNEEIALLHKEGRAAIGKPVRISQPALTSVEYRPGEDCLAIKGWLPTRRYDDKSRFNLYATVRERSGEAVEGLGEKEPFDGNTFELSLDTADLPEGRHTVAVSVSGIRPAARATHPFTKPRRPEWLDNTLGMTDKVPAPWTALVRDGNKVAMWGRTYDWGTGFFPVSMATLGRELLARPVALDATISGRRTELIPGTMKWSEINPGRIEFENNGKLGTFNVSTKWRLEYDGYAWCRLSIEGASGQTLDGLRLEVALKPEMATLETMNMGGDHLARSGKIRRLSLDITGAPVIWLGNEVGGLQWSAETDRTWKVKNKNQKVQVIPGAEEVLLQMTLVDHPVELDGPLHVEFGLQATPVKPQPPDFRERYTVDGFWFPQWTPERRFTLALADDWKKLIANYTKAFPYHNLTIMWSGTPELKYFGTEWAAGPEGFAGSVCRASDSLIEHWLWKWKTILDGNPDFANRISGIYMDTCQPAYCLNQIHGCAVRNDEGDLKGRYPLLAAREYQKRLYVMMQEDHPEYQFIQHQSSATHMSQLAFVHQYVSGEHLGGSGGSAITRDLNYYNVPWFSFEGLQSEFMGWNLGFFPVFLPQPFRTIGGINGDVEKGVKILGPEGIPASEHVIGMLLIHDIPVWGAYMNPLPFNRVAALKEQFGWDRQVEFLPYWDNGTYVTLEAAAEPVKCSLFRRPGKVLVVVANDSDQDAQVTLRIDLAELGVAGASEALDAYQAVTVKSLVWDLARLRQRQEIRTEKEFPGRDVKIPVEDGTLQFQVKRRNFRALEIGGGTAASDDGGLEEFLKNQSPITAE